MTESTKIVIGAFAGIGIFCVGMAIYEKFREWRDIVEDDMERDLEHRVSYLEDAVTQLGERLAPTETA